VFSEKLGTLPSNTGSDCAQRIKAEARMCTYVEENLSWAFQGWKERRAE
jgi:hypothetical protein